MPPKSAQRIFLAVIIIALLIKIVAFPSSGGNFGARIVIGILVIVCWLGVILFRQPPKS